MARDAFFEAGVRLKHRGEEEKLSDVIRLLSDQVTSERHCYVDFAVSRWLSRSQIGRGTAGVRVRHGIFLEWIYSKIRNYPYTQQ